MRSKGAFFIWIQGEKTKNQQFICKIAKKYVLLQKILRLWNSLRI